jgi:hypothetical protein
VKIFGFTRLVQRTTRLVRSPPQHSEPSQALLANRMDLDKTLVHRILLSLHQRVMGARPLRSSVVICRWTIAVIRSCVRLCGSVGPQTSPFVALLAYSSLMTPKGGNTRRGSRLLRGCVAQYTYLLFLLMLRTLLTTCGVVFSVSPI